MRVAIVGSRDINEIEDFGSFLPSETTSVVSGGARGVDRIARNYARMHDMELIEILPDYKLYGSRAPLVRNDRIIEMADLVLAFWDGRSGGTAYVIRRCHEKGVPVRVFVRQQKDTVRDESQLSFFGNGDARPCDAIPEMEELRETEPELPQDPTDRIW